MPKKHHDYQWSINYPRCIKKKKNHWEAYLKWDWFIVFPVGWISGYLPPTIGNKGQAFVKDSQDIISLVQEQEVDDSTVDVESLHTNIRQKDAINAAEWAFHKYSDIKQEQVQLILDGLDMAMFNN